MAAGRIGAEYGSVDAAAQGLDLAGDASETAGADASQVAQQMESGLDEVTSMLKGHFEEMATDLKQRVADHQKRLAETDWQGTSKDNAVAASEALTGEVDTVLSNALDSVETFRSAMHTKADEFREAIETEFMAAMREADASYKEMGTAARTYVENLREVDQNSIRFSG
jgi:NAD(P)-dependent dehydrogenase (short-subunit alcohol dehydrogenase family)